MSRIEKEKRVVNVMVRLYCRKKEGNSELCDSCRQLLAYASRGWNIARSESAKRRAADAQCIATSRRCADRCAR